jgi:hypothetical protein
VLFGFRMVSINESIFNKTSMCLFIAMRTHILHNHTAVVLVTALLLQRGDDSSDAFKALPESGSFESNFVWDVLAGVRSQ